MTPEQKRKFAIMVCESLLHVPIQSLVLFTGTSVIYASGYNSYATAAERSPQIGAVTGVFQAVTALLSYYVVRHNSDIRNSLLWYMRGILCLAGGASVFDSIDDLTQLAIGQLAGVGIVFGGLAALLLCCVGATSCLKETVSLLSNTEPTPAVGLSETRTEATPEPRELSTERSHVGLFPAAPSQSAPSQSSNEALPPRAVALELV